MNPLEMQKMMTVLMENPHMMGQLKEMAKLAEATTTTIPPQLDESLPLPVVSMPPDLSQCLERSIFSGMKLLTPENVFLQQVLRTLQVVNNKLDSLNDAIERDSAGRRLFKDALEKGMENGERGLLGSPSELVWPTSEKPEPKPKPKRKTNAKRTPSKQTKKKAKRVPKGS